MQDNYVQKDIQFTKNLRTVEDLMRNQVIPDATGVLYDPHY